MDNLKLYLNWIILIILFLGRTVLALQCEQSNWHFYDCGNSNLKQV